MIEAPLGSGRFAFLELHTCSYIEKIPLAEISFTRLTSFRHKIVENGTHVTAVCLVCVRLVPLSSRKCHLKSTAGRVSARRKCEYELTLSFLALDTRYVSNPTQRTDDQ